MIAKSIRFPGISCVLGSMREALGSEILKLSTKVFLLSKRGIYLCLQSPYALVFLKLATVKIWMSWLTHAPTDACILGVASFTGEIC